MITFETLIFEGGLKTGMDFRGLMELRIACSKKYLKHISSLCFRFLGGRSFFVVTKPHNSISTGVTHGLI